MSTFQALLELQEMDQDLLNRRRVYSQITSELKETVRRLRQLRDECEEAKRSQTTAEVALKRLELERASENQKRAAAEDRLYSGAHMTSARDVIQIEEQIQGLENRIALIEDRIDPVRTQANDARETHEELSVKLAEMEADWEIQKAEGAAEQTRISEEYNQALELRNETADDIPDTQLSEYIRLFKINAGKAVATVARDVCSGCSERLSMGELTRLKHSTEPVLCHCGKYLITLDQG